MSEAMTLNKHHLTPAEAIAMRDKLAERLMEAPLTVKGTYELADWLIESGWVVAPPKNEGESNEQEI